ncbi:RNA-directed DNA polymerase, eukaryota, reverse transcriptase zinc-binding domain protein [Tanacetum coccineum]
MGSKELWHLCDQHGTVADVYIARKLSKIGRRFVFVRFLKVRSTGSLIEELNKIWIGSYHLFAAMARFERKPNVTSKSIPKPSNNHPSNQPKTASFSSHANPNRSNATALNGKTSQNFESKERVILKSVTLDVTDLLDTSDMRNVILAKVRDVHLILNINNVLKKRVFMTFNVNILEHVTQSFKADERVVWIEIGGLPLNAWTSKAYKKIAGSWGEPLFVDEDPHDNVAMGRVCIKTKIQGQITDTCKVVIHGKPHNVWVKEFAGWVPDIKVMESLSSKTSEMDNSDNHDQDFSDNGFQDAEEGEIHKANISQEEEVVKNTQWSVGVEQIEKDHDDTPINMESHKQQSKETSETQKEESESISKPPGFEGYKTNSPQFSVGGNHQKSKQPSTSLFAAAKSSRVSKSHSKSFNNHGSMIEAFISHIEMGNILGYYMEGSKNDLKKFIDSLGAKQGIQETHSLTIDSFKVKSLLGNFQFDYAVCPSSGRSVGDSGKPHNVWVKEFAGWVPDIKVMESLSSKNFEMDNSDNHDQDFSDNGFQDAEEGEIHKANISQEEEVVKNTHWSVGVEQIEKDHDDTPINMESHKQQSKKTSETQKEESESISKPPGFEAAYPSRGSIQETHFSPLIDSFRVESIRGIFSNSINAVSSFFWHDQDEKKKERLWYNILDFKDRNPGHYFIFGDFNVDIPLRGHLFTRINNRGDKLSKLDRFLITENSASFMHNYSTQVLDCHISDHRPILLSPSSSDFGPIPFKFYNSWLLDKNLHDIVAEFWERHVTENGFNLIVSFKNKMKALKPIIKEWSNNQSSSQSRDKEDLIKKIKEFDDNIVRGTGDVVVGSQRITWLTNLRSIELKENLDFSQKAKIKWGIEADENSKLFHATVNQKRRYLSIHGIKHEGKWLSEPHRIKDAFYSFFESKFQRVDVVKIVNRSPFYKSLHEDQNSFLVSTINVTEIRDAIWDCGSDKSPGPNGFTFAFYKKFWDILKDDVMGFVQDFFRTGILPRGCNTSFITLILKVPNPMVISDFRPISLIGAQYKIIAKVLANRLARVIDSVISQEQSAFIKNRQKTKLLVNEVIQWCKRIKTKLLVFKIDFEKAFDSISWDFLFQVMHFMGFSEKWMKWISGCLFSATSSILINGSPTHEFNINRGLRQGDPLSPFLFVIAMEGLHVAIEDAMAAGEWSRANIKSLVSILECFHRVSSLKINFHKSNLFGVGVPFEEVNLSGSITGCNAMQTPFSYLGLPIDCNMANVKSWDPIFDKFSKRLSKWKSSLLSIGGRSTLISSVLGSIVLASKGKWGLGIGSLYSLNHALIQKWRWRFFNNPQSLWVRLLTSIHSDTEDASIFFSHVGNQGVWGRIVGSINTMHAKGFIPHSFLHKRVNNGTSTKFCNACIYGSLGQGDIKEGLRDGSMVLGLGLWSKRQGVPSFTVKTTREHIDQCYFPNSGLETRWNRYLPKKINIFIWRALRDRLPTRWNLSRKGIDVDSLFCPDFYKWLDDLHISSPRKSILEVICGVVLWSLWNFRNELIFGTVPPKRCTLIDKIVDYSYRWYSTRNKLSSITWNNWLRNPLEVSTLYTHPRIEVSQPALYAGSDQEGANHCTISGTPVDTTPSSPTLMTSVVVAPEGEERDIVRRPQLTTPLNPASNITSSIQTQLVTPVHPDVQAVDKAFVMANYSRLEPLMRRRMRELRLQGIATHLGYSSDDVDDEREMEAPPGFQSQSFRELEGQVA